eukprot:14212113-Alexandrium_andersonii.AAC.1
MGHLGSSPSAAIADGAVVAVAASLAVHVGAFPGGRCVCGVRSGEHPALAARYTCHVRSAQATLPGELKHACVGA